MIPIEEAKRISPYLQPFYSSRAWRDCRDAYARSVGGLCERCRAKGLITPGTEVHHKVRLNPQTVKDPHVALAWSNLELLCEGCHHEEHRKTQRRWRCDERGRVIAPL